MTSSPPLKIAVLISGRGSNLAALIRHLSPAGSPARIEVVISSRANAPGLDYARKAGIPFHVLALSEYPSRPRRDRALVNTLKGYAVEWVVLAGFMEILTQPMLAAFPRRILNIHPSLLPAFPGIHAVEEALACGVKVTGVTVHLVDEGVDTGPILYQKTVPVHEGDTPETLHKRIQAVEHDLLPRVVVRLVTDKQGKLLKSS